jgi:hypothetical protein
MPENSDPYLYPGTDVLRNLADLRDPITSAAFEANATACNLLILQGAKTARKANVLFRLYKNCKNSDRNGCCPKMSAGGFSL